MTCCQDVMLRRSWRVLTLSCAQKKFRSRVNVRNTLITNAKPAMIGSFTYGLDTYTFHSTYTLPIYISFFTHP